MSRPIRIIEQDESPDIHDVLADQAAWGEQPPSHVPGEILISDHPKVEEILAEARRRGKTIVERKSSLVAVGAALIGVSSAIGAAWWAAHENHRKKKRTPSLRISALLNKSKT